MEQVKKAGPILVSIGLLIIMAAYAPWEDVLDAFQKLSWGHIFALFILSVVYYALKTLRFWYLLKGIKVREPLPIVSLSYMSAQPVSLLPAGEIYRSHTLERYTGVPVKKSLPQFTSQGLLEGLSMAICGIVAAMAIGHLRLPVLAVAFVAGATMLAVQQGFLKDALSLVNKVPFINMSRQAIQQFSKAHQALFAPRQLPSLLGLSVLIELIGAAIAYVAVTGIGGHVTPYQAILVYVISLLAGFVSFLPGGFGASEQSAVGVLLIADNNLGIAVAGTLLMRISIVGTGVLYGFLTMALGRILEAKAVIKAEGTS